MLWLVSIQSQNRSVVGKGFRPMTANPEVLSERQVPLAASMSACHGYQGSLPGVQKDNSKMNTGDHDQHRRAIPGFYSCG